MAFGTTPLREQFNNINVPRLIERKIADPSTPLSLEKRIALLVGCITRGEEQATNFRQQNNQNTLFFLGNTGSGKSTLINYLAGCELTLIDPSNLPPDAGGMGTEDVVIVRSTSAQPEIMKIGHTTLSQTFVPEVATVANRTYCDCPGFLDNRGVEINVANVINTRKMLQEATCLKVVMLVNYRSLDPVRGKGLTSMVDIAKQLFGNRETFNAAKESLLFGVTKVGDRPMNRQQMPLSRLQDQIRGFIRANQDPFTQEILEAFADRLFIYHPLDQLETPKFSGSLSRNVLLQRLDSIPPIINPQNVFNIPLNDSDEIGLREICEQMGARISEKLQQQHHDDANTLLEFLYLIRQIEHPFVRKLVEDCRQDIVLHFREIKGQISQELASNANALTDRAETLFDIISSGISAFGEEDARYIEREIDLESLRTLYETHARRIDFKIEDREVVALAQAFRAKCYAFDFQGAEGDLEAIRTKLQAMENEYQDLGLNTSVNLTILETQLAATRNQKESLDQAEANLTEARREFNETVEALQKSREEDRAEFERERQKHEIEIAKLQGEMNGLRKNHGGGGGGWRCIIS